MGRIVSRNVNDVGRGIPITKDTRCYWAAKRSMCLWILPSSSRHNPKEIKKKVIEILNTGIEEGKSFPQVRAMEMINDVESDLPCYENAKRDQDLCDVRLPLRSWVGDGQIGRAHV